MSGECQVNVKSQYELDIGGRETCFTLNFVQVTTWYSVMKFADENKNGNLSLREFKKLVELAEDMDRGKKKQESKK